jgi:spore coat polysaccharide biosynthesis protein SpsF
MKKNLCIIQARTGSARIPGKVLLEVNGRTILEHEIRRVLQAKRIDKVVVATTKEVGDDPIAVLAGKIGVSCFRGSSNDVLDRFYKCSLEYPDYQTIIRVTGDCPLIDPAIIDAVIECFEKGGYDYASNVIEETFPDGMDVEVFSKAALETAAAGARFLSEREHVTLFILNNPKFKKSKHTHTPNLSNFRLTVDWPEDFEVIKFLIKHSTDKSSCRDYIDLLLKHPEIMAKNQHIKRNEGLKKSLREDGLANESG